jgi:putative transposase
MATEATYKIRLSDVISQAQQVYREKVLDLVRWFVELSLERYRDAFIGGKRYERSKRWKRYGYRRRKGYQTSWGWLKELRIPRIRGDEGEVSYLERFERQGEEVVRAVMSTVVGGMSLRRVQGHLAQVFGDSLSWVALGKLVERLSRRLEYLRQERIGNGEYVGLVLDGLWGHLRRARGGGGSKPKRVVVVAVGIQPDGSYRVLDWQAGRGEAEALYEVLLQRLYDRGLEALQVIVSDNVEGVRGAAATVYPAAGVQLCLWHFARQLERALPPLRWWQRLRFRWEYWQIWKASTQAEALERLQVFCRRWRRRAPQMVEAFLQHQRYLFEHYRYPISWRHRLRTTNILEGCFHHLRRYLLRYPGWVSDQHIERIVLLHLLALPGLFPRPEIPWSSLIQNQNFNTAT